jgi:two-component system chemotaxis response regulator CheY
MKRILIVDDAATVRMYHRDILESAGYAVEEAWNGIEALEKALQEPFDLYLVDVNMPKLDGYGFLRELRQQEIPQMPAIIVSTEAEATMNCKLTGRAPMAISSNLSVPRSF